ncbi:MAG: SDR family NAD(P)-dependent oxidoreductase [Bacillota bacterium]
MKKRVAIVTGGAGGIGKEICRLLLQKNVIVVAVGRSEEKLKTLVSELGNLGEISYFAADVTKGEEVKLLVDKVQKRYGRIDILVNNAGGSMGLKKNIEDIEEEEWNTLIRSNLTSTYLCCKYVVPIMKKTKWGRIVNISSQAGRNISFFGSSAYCSAKAGVIGLTRQVAYELATYGVTVNAIAPGLIETERIKNYWRNKNETDRSERLKTTPMGRLGHPEEIASAVAYLCSDGASYITGVVLDVNGGSFIG